MDNPELVRQVNSQEMDTHDIYVQQAPRKYLWCYFAPLHVRQWAPLSLTWSLFHYGGRCGLKRQQKTTQIVETSHQLRAVDCATLQMFPTQWSKSTSLNVWLTVWKSSRALRHQPRVFTLFKFTLSFLSSSGNAVRTVFDPNPWPKSKTENVKQKA